MVIIIYTFVLGYSLKKERKKRKESKRKERKKDRRKEILYVLTEHVRINAF